MQRPSDEKLIAYLDGELAEGESAELAAYLEGDAELRARAARLGKSAALLRAAFDETLREPLPERLVAAARGEPASADATVVSLSEARARKWDWLLRKRGWGDRRWWVAVPAAASLFGLMVGAGLGYFARESPAPVQQAQNASLGGGNWLDNVAGYHKLFIAAGNGGDAGLVDVPPNDKAENAHKVAQKLPSDIRLPNLKPWGLAFEGARFLFIEGQPATQLFYTTDNKALGPVTLVIGSSQKPDSAPDLAHRGEVNMIFWRHRGHAYALVGTANVGYLWNLANDIAYQLDAI